MAFRRRTCKVTAKPQTPPKGYSPTVAAILTGINYNTILYWVRDRLVNASVLYKSRQWAPVLLSFEDILELMFVKVLRNNGVNTRRIRKALVYLRRQFRRGSVTGLCLDVTSEHIMVLDPAKSMREASLELGYLITIDVGRLEDMLRKKLKEMDTGRPEEDFRGGVQALQLTSTT